MSANDPTLSEDLFADWLAACDAAIAAGAAPPLPSDLNLPPEVRERLQRGLAGLRLLDQLRLPRLPSSDQGPGQPHGATTDAENGETGPATSLPWTSLGRFQLRRELGRGGCGIVYLAHDPLLDREVALKVPHLAAACSPAMRERFLREARAASGLDHANIVPVHEAGQIGPVCYIVSAYCPGLTLAEWLGRRAAPMPFREAASLIASLADAIAHAHGRGVVHRDLKPANVLLQQDKEARGQGDNETRRQGDNEIESVSLSPCLLVSLSDLVPRITDFGLAKLLDSANEGPTRSGVILGTVNYMAPEQASGKVHAIGPAADIYALGAILYELLAGRPPFQGESDLDTLRSVQSEEPIPPARLKSRVPRDLETVCLKCLHKEPHRRYASAAALAEDLRRYLDNRPILARRPSRSEVAWRWCRRNPMVSTLAASILMLLLAASIVSLIAAEHFRVQRNQLIDAERETNKELVRSLAAQVRAGRRSGLPGRRFDSLETLAKAVQLRAALDETDDLPTVKELRDEMIGCLILADLRASRRWAGFPAGSTRLVFDAALTRYARSQRDGTVRVARVADDEEVACFAGPPAGGHLLSLSPNGRFVAVASEVTGRLQIWDVESGELLGNDFEHVLGVLAFCPLSRRLAIGHRDGGIALFDVVERRGIKRLKGDGRTVASAIAWRPDGKQIAINHWPLPRVQVRDVEEDTIVAELTHPGAVMGSAWSPDGKRLAVASDVDRKIYVWDVAARTKQMELAGHDGWTAGTLAFQPQGDLLASCGWDSTLRLWDLRSGVERFRLTAHLAELRFSPDGQTLAGTTQGEEVTLWQVASGRAYRTIRNAAFPVPGLGWGKGCLSPDGRIVAMGMSDGIRLWELDSGKELAWLPSGRTGGLQFAPDGTALFSVSPSAGSYYPGGVYRWPIQRDPKAPQRLRIRFPEKLLPGLGEHLALGPDGRTLAVATELQGGRILDLGPPPVLGPLFPHSKALSAALSPDGRWLATATQHGDGVKVWQVQSRTLAAHLRPQERDSSANFSPDGRWLATCWKDSVRFHRVGPPWTEGAVVPRDGGSLSGPVAFSGDGKMAAAEVSPGRIRLLDPETGREFATLEDPSAHRPGWFAFTPDDTKLVVAVVNPLVLHIWDLRFLRTRLAEAGLDWDVLPYPAPAERSVGGPFEIQVELNAESYEHKAASHTLRQEWRPAAAAYREALACEPDRYLSCNNLAWIYVAGPVSLRDPGAARPLAERAAAKDPSNVSLNTLGLVYYRLGEWDKATLRLEEAVKARGKDGATPWDLYFLAMCHHRRGHASEAKRCYEQAIAARAKVSNLTFSDQAELDEIEAEAQVVLGQAAGR